MNVSVKWWLLPALIMAGCTSAPAVRTLPGFVAGAPLVPFSINAPGDSLPAGWQPWILSRLNRNTQYRIVEDAGACVLEANADSSASGLLQQVRLDAGENPILSWRWRVSQLAPGADVKRPGSDDSPARIIVSFDGDRKKFDFEDRAMASLVKAFSGRDMPYATLMYVWDGNLPVGTFVENPHSARAMMIVVESGGKRIGEWLGFSRNLVEDYQRAFGELPGPIISVGVMTDSNATHSRMSARYGDISLTALPGGASLHPQPPETRSALISP
jgi:Protein of unknown function (DUF3047)